MSGGRRVATVNLSVRGANVLENLGLWAKTREEIAENLRARSAAEGRHPWEVLQRAKNCGVITTNEVLQALGMPHPKRPLRCPRCHQLLPWKKPS